MDSLLATEAQEQITLIKRVKYYPLIEKHLTASANGELRNKIIAKRLKLMGVKAGVSDIFFAYPFKGYAGLWIELKRKNATQSHLKPEQKEWLRRMCDAGYMAKMAAGADEAWEIITSYLDGKCEYDEWYSKSKANKQIMRDNEGCR